MRSQARERSLIRATDVVKHLGRDRSQQQATESPEAFGSHHDQIRALTLRNPFNNHSRVAIFNPCRLAYVRELRARKLLQDAVRAVCEVLGGRAYRESR